jgi:hypothetical protein
MKKSILLVAILALVGTATAVAQPRAIGLNLGYGIDLSYQHSLSDANMIDLSVNIPAFAGIGVTATYDWVNPFGTAIPWNNKGEWNWNLGVGAGLGVYNPFRTQGVLNEHGELDKEWAGKIYVGAVGHVGVEYNFWFPLQLSLDYRPNIGVAITSDGAPLFNGIGLFSGITLGVRYLF